MAERRKLDTHPQLAGGTSRYKVQSRALDDNGFNSVVRLIKTGRLAQIDQIKEAVFTNMKRLRLHTKGFNAIVGIPEGSDQIDIGTIISWAGGVGRKDEPAKEQLVLLAVTINARLV